MPKISATNSKGLFIGYFLKIVLSTIISIVLFNLITSFLFLKLDVNLSLAKYAGIAVCVLTAIVISIVSVSGFKNNFLLLSVISEIPFLLFIFINALIHKSNSTICIIKLVAVLAAAIVISLIKSAKKR